MMEHKETNTLVIGFAGDVMIGRLVNEQIAKTHFRYPWGNVLPTLLSTDLNIINLETALTHSEDRVEKTFNFKAPPEYVAVLKEARIDAVNLANNHILDFGINGLRETIAVLDNNNIYHVGAGENIEAAAKPVVLTKNNVRIGLLGFTDNEPGWAATAHAPGTNYIRIGQIDAVKEGIEKIKGEVDIVIISIHWGPNMRQKPSARFVDFAHQMIEAGADIIHGHSAHIFQKIEWYRQKLILYDTGDFIDDYLVDPALRNDCSFLFLCTVNKKGIKKLQLIPVRISNMQVNLATGADEEWCKMRMSELMTI